MKIAIICPAGDVTRFGYQRTARICLESWRAVGDLFLVQSSRVDLPFEIDAVCLRDESTLMRLQADQQERFDYARVAANANQGLQAARRAGYDIGVTICVNWYVEEVAAALIMQRCQIVLGGGGGFGFLFRRWQLGSVLLDADLKSPCLFNLRKLSGDPVRVLVDEAVVNGMQISRQRGVFAPYNREAYIDTEFEITEKELKEKLIDVRNYEDLLPKRAGVDWSYWQDYYRQHLMNLKRSGDPLGEVGKRIAKAKPTKSVGEALLREWVND